MTVHVNVMDASLVRNGERARLCPSPRYLPIARSLSPMRYVPPLLYDLPPFGMTKGCQEKGGERMGAQHRSMSRYSP